MWDSYKSLWHLSLNIHQVTTIVYCYLLMFTLNINYLSYCLNNLSNISSFLSVGYQSTFIYLALFTTKTITALGVLESRYISYNTLLLQGHIPKEYKHLEKMKVVSFSWKHQAIFQNKCTVSEIIIFIPESYEISRHKTCFVWFSMDLEYPQIT